MQKAYFLAFEKSFTIIYSIKYSNTFEVIDGRVKVFFKYRLSPLFYLNKWVSSQNLLKFANTFTIQKFLKNIWKTDSINNEKAFYSTESVNNLFHHALMSWIFLVSSLDIKFCLNKITKQCYNNSLGNNWLLRYRNI